MHNLPYVAWIVLNWTASERLVMQISIYYVHKVDVQRRDSIFAPCPQTYATAAFGEGWECEGANVGVCQSAAAAAVMVGGVSVCSGTATAP